MREHVLFGDMVEGQKTAICARRIDFKKLSLQKHEITGILMVEYTLDRNCSVEVVEPIALTEEQEALRSPHPIFREVGDKLIADAVRLYVAGRRNVLDAAAKEGVSHRHGANVAHCPYHSIGKIQTPWQGHLKLQGMSANENEPKKLQK